jgi:translation initiation factor 2 beta subunit (eIF-2beta)/eIF-5
MSYSQEPQPTREVQYTVTVDEETGAVTLSSQFSREEIDNRIQESVVD